MRKTLQTRTNIATTTNISYPHQSFQTFSIHLHSQRFL